MTSKQSATTSGQSAPFMFLSLPGPCLQAVLRWWCDTRDVAVLSCCCKATAKLCRDQHIWKELLEHRHGKSALPEEAPAPGSQEYQPVRLDGWTFVQGLNASVEGDVAVEGAESAQQLAKACSNTDGAAFTTSGKVITGLSDPMCWKRSSYKPYEGMYVRDDIAAVLDMQQQPTDAQGNAAA